MNIAARVCALARPGELLVTDTAFDPSRKLEARRGPFPPTTTTNVLSRLHGVPVVLMELRIGTSKKLGRRPTVEDRLKFGRQLVVVMARAVQ